MHNAFLGLSIVAGFLSAALWFFAACIRVPTTLISGYGGTAEGLDEMRLGFRERRTGIPLLQPRLRQQRCLKPLRYWSPNWYSEA